MWGCRVCDYHIETKFQGGRWWLAWSCNLVLGFPNWEAYCWMFLAGGLDELTCSMFVCGSQVECQLLAVSTLVMFVVLIVFVVRIAASEFARGV